MKKGIVFLVSCVMLLFLYMAATSFASQPPGLLGFEGQPGNQGGGGGQPPGLLGFEGQPGNQGGH